MFLNTHESLQVPSNTHPGSVGDHGPNSWPCFVLFFKQHRRQPLPNSVPCTFLLNSVLLPTHCMALTPGFVCLSCPKALSNMSSVRQQTSPTEVPANTSSFPTKADHSHASNKIALPVMPEVAEVVK